MSQLTLTPRLAREVEHFDHHYAQEAVAGIAPLSDYDRLRYTDPAATTIFPREFFYHLLAPLQGKDTLEIACGNGIDASICAHNGANVHAYDLSAQSIEMTRRRVEANGVADRVRLERSGSFESVFPGQTFDAILGYAALHHLDNLDALSAQVHARLRPGGVAVFAEPVVNSSLLHAVRRCVPFGIDACTDDETPLNRKAIRRFARPFDRLVMRDFQMVSRVWRLWPDNWPLTVTLHRLDHLLLKLPPLRPFATVTVFALHRKK